jgi:uncharacterized membrane protein
VGKLTPDVLVAQNGAFGVYMALVIATTLVAIAYLSLRYSMARFAVVDGEGITDSLRKSAQETKGVKWHLLGFFLALIGLNILGAVALLVGLLVTLPVSAIAYAHVYLKLKNRA